jgi:ferredoxin-type protein NapH
MIKQKPIRQSLRSALMLVSLLLFPITLNYFSPYVIVQGASQGIINGSFIVFGSLFFLSLFIGRLWCSWVCPVGAIGDACMAVNNKTVNGRHIYWIKWIIWVPWIILITTIALRSGGYHSVNFFLDTENGISVAGSPERPIFIAYIIYYMVIALFAILAVIVGRRAGCHAVCWISPFMIVGRKIRNWLHLPALHLKAEPDNCTKCNTCTTNCPMSLDVTSMVQRGKMENSECILCGNCVDGCARSAIRFAFDNN